MSKGARIKAQREESKREGFAGQTASQNSAEKANQYNAFTNPKNINWVLLSGAMAILVLSLLFMPQELGAGITSVYSIMLWTGLFGATLARYIGKNGWLGFFTGSVFGMLIHIFAPLIQAMM
uniref:hypothetical protein n=1 Tax=Ningiella ruwaisensis TaxID=2364274 RepID=UPI001F4FD0F6|nr:hypothetical protein [Ningiella ruwaisensis]